MTNEQIKSVMDATLQRLNIPINPKESNSVENSLKVVLIIEFINVIMAGSGLLGKKEAIEIGRASLDALELIGKENK